MELNKLHNESVKAIFGMLYDILSLYESSGCYNYIPDTENSDDAPEYFGGLIENIRKKLNADFLNERDNMVCQKLDRIIGETEVFVKSYSVPGVVTRWQTINPQINYFDCVFDIIDELGPEEAQNLYREGRLAFFPSDDFIKARKDYFAQKELANVKDNPQYSEERIFQDELLRTLAMVFENDFGSGIDYLPAV